MMATSLVIAAALTVGPAEPERPDYTPTSSKAPGDAATSSDPAPADPPSAGPDYSPTSSKAPTADPIEPMQPLEDAEPVVEAEPEPEAPPPPKFNRHGVGARGGIVVLPTWFLASWVETQTNALCRGDAIGSYARDRGLLRTDGCNFYVGGEYTYRKSRIFDIVGAVSYQRAKLPDGFWLDKGSFEGTGQSLVAADYTEVDLSMLAFEADFIWRAPVVQNEKVEVGIGGGAGIGLGIVFGEVFQTGIGSLPDGYVPGQGPTAGSTCENPEDLADFNRCTPRYDQNLDPDRQAPNPEELDDPNAELYASCDGNKCSAADLSAFGYRNASNKVPPVIPVVNLILSARVIIKDTVGITINGGFNTGFYFGAGLTYFFGKDFQTK